MKLFIVVLHKTFLNKLIPHAIPIEIETTNSPNQVTDGTARVKYYQMYQTY